MIFCSECFSDVEIKARINSVGIRGICPICGSQSKLFDTGNFDNADTYCELASMFEELIDIYEPAKSLPDDFPKANPQRLSYELVEHWNIFNRDIFRDKLDKVHDILTNICKDAYRLKPELFDSPVGIPQIIDKDYLKEHSLLKECAWNEFVDELKTKNRFHTNKVNLGILERQCSFARKTYKSGVYFYRSRLSPTNEGFKPNEMGAPPKESVRPGRANPEGVRCLYLADHLETAIHEIRAGIHDYVSVGKFKLKHDAVVVDLRSLGEIHPFAVEGMDFVEYAVNREHLKKIGSEIGRPQRRGDSVLDYIATQYISDFIKSIQDNGTHTYSGLVYKSTLYPKGHNVAFFYEDLLKCTKVETYEIKELNYLKELVK